MPSLIVKDCPRCNAKQITLEVLSITSVGGSKPITIREMFCRCRACTKTTVFKVRGKDAINDLVLTQLDPLKGSGVITELLHFEGYVSLADDAVADPPVGMPLDVAAAFNEGAKCVKVRCPNAAAAMFRLALDLATSPLLPSTEDPVPNAKVRRDLGLRLNWLFENGRLPPELRPLSNCVREDGNDGAHRGGLTAEDALDIEDFAAALFERLFTEQHRLSAAEQRRAVRRTAAVKR